MNNLYGGYILQRGDNDRKGIYEGKNIGKNLGYVKELQQDLLTLGFSLPKYGADGDFGLETEEAVIAFQKTIIYNGKVDKFTALKIKELKLKKEQKEVLPKYEVNFYKGDYSIRQLNANRDNAICYYEQHFNSHPQQTSSGIEILITDNASPITIRWAELLAENFYKVLGTRLRHSNGILEIRKGNRGYGNLAKATMPAILAEPLFISNPEEVTLLKKNISTLGEAIANSIKEIFPKGGLVAFSVGHKYRDKFPKDRGAKVIGEDKYEADYAEEVLLAAKEQLCQK